MKKVLVLDANQRSALAVIRSLGRRGVLVFAADCIGHTIGSASKYATTSFQYANPTINPTGFLKDIGDGVQRFGIDVVIPATDLTTMLLVDHLESIGSARLACPSAQSYETLTDKQRLVLLAQQLNVTVPETRIATTPAEILATATDFGYPLVLKPGRSRYMKDKRIISTTVCIADSREHLDALLKHLDWLNDIPCLVQRFIPGHGAGIFAVCGPKGPIAWFAHKRIREKPPSGGVSVLSESATVDPLMQRSAEKLLAAANWFGVAMIEYRVSTDGMPYLMEVNGRFWGSLQLAIDAGVDFPWLLYNLVNGGTPDVASTYIQGRRLRWLMGDVDNLLLQLRDSRISALDKVKTIGQFLRSFVAPACRQEVFRWSDPGPAMREMRQWLGALTQ